MGVRSSHTLNSCYHCYALIQPKLSAMANSCRAVIMRASIVFAPISLLVLGSPTQLSFQHSAQLLLIHSPGHQMSHAVCGCFEQGDTHSQFSR